MAKITRTLFVAAALLATAQLAHAQREAGRPGQQEVRVVVKSIDAAAITVAMGAGRDAAPMEKTFTLAKNVEVCVGAGGGFRGGFFKEIKLKEVTPGSAVGLVLSGEKIVESIIAEEPTVRGALKAIDAKKRSLTVSTGFGREQPDEEKTFQAADDVEVAIDDGRGRRFSIHEGKLEDLTQGAIVTLRLSLDKTRVHGILAEGAMVQGTVKEVDAAKRSLVLVIRPARGDDAGEERTVMVAKEAIVLIDDGKGRRLSLKEGKLADVPIGAAVTAKLSVDQNFVMMLKADGPMLVGFLKGVDAAKGTITVGIPKSRTEVDEKTLPLAKDAVVTLDGNAAKLADLKVGEDGPYIQLRLSLDQKTVQSVTARQPGVR
jgi:hypothetical protein